MNEVVIGRRPASSAAQPVEVVVETIDSDEEELEHKAKEKQRKPVSIMKPIKKEQVERSVESEMGLEEPSQDDRRESEERSWRRDSDADEPQEEEEAGRVEVVVPRGWK